jgi:hypothetical protein
MGVEVDEWQRPVAYWLYPRHPGDYTIASTAPSNTWQRVPADEVIHIAMFDRPMQTRGVPWLHAAMIKLRHTGGFEEALIVKARASASVMGFIQSRQPGHGRARRRATTRWAPTTWSTARRSSTWRPASSRSWRPARPSTASRRTARRAVEPFMRFLVRSFAVGTGISYESVSRDYSQSNYSSSRLALTEDRDHYRVLQAWLIRRFHQRVFERGWTWRCSPASWTCRRTRAIRRSTRRALVAARLGLDRSAQGSRRLQGRGACRLHDRRRRDRGEGRRRRGDVQAPPRELDLAAEYDLVLDTDPAQVNDKGALQGRQVPAPGRAGPKARMATAAGDRPPPTRSSCRRSSSARRICCSKPPASTP